jgi:hypothetical protein
MTTRDIVITQDGKETLLTITKPNDRDVEASRHVYSAEIAKQVRIKGPNRPLLRLELEAHLKNSGIWTEEDEAKVEALRADIVEQHNILRAGQGGLKDVGRKAALKAMKLREEIVNVYVKRRYLDDNTVEYHAEQAQRDYLNWACTVHAEDGSNYWSDVEAMKLDKASQAYDKALTIIMEDMYGISPDIEKNLPEQKWLRKHKFLDEQGNYINPKTGEMVDEDFTPYSQVQEKNIQILQSIFGEIQEENQFVDDIEESNPNPQQEESEKSNEENSFQQSNATGEVKNADGNKQGKIGKRRKPRAIKDDTNLEKIEVS